RQIRPHTERSTPKKARGTVGRSSAGSDMGRIWGRESESISRSKPIYARQKRRWAPEILAGGRRVILALAVVRRPPEFAQGRVQRHKSHDPFAVRHRLRKGHPGFLGRRTLGELSDHAHEGGRSGRTLLSQCGDENTASVL